MKGFIKKYAGLLSALALALTTLTVNSTCIYTMGYKVTTIGVLNLQ